MPEGAGDTGEEPVEPADGISGEQERGRADRSWSERAHAQVEPDSPFYVPPPSSRALRWSIAVRLVLPTVLAVVVVMSAVGRHWTAAAIAGGLLCVTGTWHALLIRAALRELAKKRE